MKRVPMLVVSNSEADTIAFGMRLGRLIKGPLTLELISDLGGGKTTLVKGIANGLGYTQDVTSPTFTINRSYNLPLGKRLEHFDLYRLGELGIMEPELAEATTDPDAVVVVEWPERSEHILPTDRLIIKISTQSESSRQFQLESTGPISNELLKGLE